MTEHKYSIVVDFNGESEKGANGYESTFATTNSGSTKSNKEEISSFQNFKAFANAVVGSALVKQSFQWGVQIVEREMGNSDVSQKVNTAMQLAGTVVAIGGAFAAGGAIGGAMALAGVGISFAKEIEQNNYERQWETINRKLMVERAGASLNRSRNV